ncbi:MAG: hypothetical protein ACWGON_08860 [Gemmatimonadota bacterium]
MLPVFVAVAATGLLAACNGSSGPTAPIEPEGCLDVNLLPGEEVTVGDAAVVDCIVLPAAAAGTAYEVIATTMARTLGFSPMELQIGPVAASAARIAGPTGSTGASPVPGPAVDRTTAAWRSGQSAWDQRMRQLEAPLLPEIRSRAASTGFGLFAVPSVGDTLDFGFSCITQGDFPNAPSSVTGIVRQVSARAVVVEDTTVPGSFSDAEYAAIAANFDDPIYDSDVAYFGPPGDIDQNGGRVVLLYAGGVNKLSESYDAGFIAGFTCPLDLGFAGGNNAEMFYLMVPDPGGDLTPGVGDGITKEEVLRFTDNTVAHEFQHLINAQTGNGGAQDIWLNEGLSHLAEEVVGNALLGVEPGTNLGPEDLLSTPSQQEIFRKWHLNNFYNLKQYLQAPADTAALLNAEDPLDANTFRMRGSAWMFLRYVLDRMENGTAGESARTRALIQSSALDSRDAVTDVFGVAFNELATDWAGMLVIEDRDDVTASPDLDLPSYQLRAIYEHSLWQTVDPPGGYRLVPLVRALASSSNVDAELFTATGLYVTLSTGSDVGRTQLGLVDKATGAPLDASVEPRLTIVRTH